MRIGHGSWRSGLVVAAVSVVVGLVLLASDPAGVARNGLTWTCFLLAVVYAGVGLAERQRLTEGERPEARLGRPLRTGHIGGGRRPVLTRNRLANALACAAAVVGLWLVASGAGHHDPGPVPSPPAWSTGG